ncbi:MAG: hypothetical protein KC636_17760, partial [Myxococcales bacterium]|nr:hypothetical protein [Myxococcales bacterium]
MTRLEQDQEDRLGDDERALLLALRDEEAMPTDARARVWSRLEARLDEPRATAGQSPRALVVITALALAAAVSLFVFGPELGVLVNATPRPSQAPHEHEERAETRSIEPSTPTPEDPARAVELPAPTTTDVVEAPEPSPTEATPAPPVLRPRSAVASSREA